MPTRTIISVTMVLALAVACVENSSPEPKAETSPALTPDSSPAAAADGRAALWLKAACSLPTKYVTLIERSYYPGRSPDIFVVPKKPNFFGGFSGTTHSGPWDYVQKVPMVLYGPGFIRSQGEIRLNRDSTLADLAATLGELLGTPLPPDHPGVPVTEALLPAEDRPDPPKMVLVVVWDGGGWNVLERWPRAWPTLKGLMEDGTSVADVSVGSSPSVTPAIHATIGTGAWPDSHGFVDIPVRIKGRIGGPFPNATPNLLEVPTLADLYDQRVDNRAIVGMLADHDWHLGMIGHGAYIQGGDKDIAVLIKGATARFLTNPKWYSMPRYLNEIDGLDEFVRSVDLEDGQLDGLWMDHDILTAPPDIVDSPAWIPYQAKVLREMFTRENFGRDAVADLFFTNFKPIDVLGHLFNMINPEVKEAVEYSDDALASLLDWLNTEVGKGKYVVAYTADHGQAPDPQSVGAWPISMPSLVEDVAAHFEVAVSDLFADQRPTGLWLNHATMRSTGIRNEAIADFITDYRIKDNVTPTMDVPDQYRDRMNERLFSAAWPSERTKRVGRCVKRGPF
jgi:hypothetical protein